MSILSGISNLSKGVVKTTWGGIRTVAKPLALCLAPLAVSGLMIGHTLAKNLPFKIGEKYKTIYDSSVGQIVDVFSMKKGREDTKEGITNIKNGLIGSGDPTTEETKTMARFELEQAKMKNNMELTKLQLEKEEKADTNKFELEKIKRADNKERRADRRKNRTERLKNRQDGKNKKRELDNNLAITAAGHEVTKHGVEQNTAQEQIRQDAVMHQADQTLAGTKDTNEVTKHGATETRKTEENKHTQTLAQKSIDDTKDAAEKAAAKAKEAQQKIDEEIKENKSIENIIQKAKACHTTPISSTNANEQMNNANIHRTALANIAASNTKRGEADTEDIELIAYIKKGQEIIDQEKVDRQSSEFDKFINQFNITSSPCDIDESKLSTVVECDTAINKAASIQNKSINKSDITTTTLKTTLTNKTDEFQEFIDKIQQHKSKMPKSTPTFTKQSTEKAPCNILEFKSLPNTEYEISIIDKKTKHIISTESGNTVASNKIKIDLSSAPLSSGDYNIEYKLTNAFGTNESNMQITIEKEELKKPTIDTSKTIVDHNKKNGSIVIDDLDDEDELIIDVIYNGKFIKQGFKKSAGIGTSITLDLDFDKLKPGIDSDISIKITDAANPKRTASATTIVAL